MTNLSISQSKIKSWLHCKNAYYYAYVLKLVRRITSRPLQFGNWFHPLLECRINGTDWKHRHRVLTRKFNKLDLSAEDEAKLGDLPNDVLTVYGAYERYYKDDDITYLLVEEGNDYAEQFVSVPLMKGIDFDFILDAFIANFEGKQFVFDHKCMQTNPGQYIRDSDLQSATYEWGLREMEFDVAGMVWDYVGSKPPSVPKINKNGTMSVAATGTWQRIALQVIEDNSLETKDYKDFLSGLEGNEEKWFNRVWQPYRPKTMDLLMGDVKDVAKDIQKNAGKIRTRNYSYTCDRCDFRDLCLAELRGGNTSSMLRTLYKESTYAGKKEALKKEKEKQRRRK